MNSCLATLKACEKDTMKLQTQIPPSLSIKELRRTQSVSPLQALSQHLQFIDSSSTTSLLHSTLIAYCFNILVLRVFGTTL